MSFFSNIGFGVSGRAPDGLKITVEHTCADCGKKDVADWKGHGLCDHNSYYSHKPARLLPAGWAEPKYRVYRCDSCVAAIEAAKNQAEAFAIAARRVLGATPAPPPPRRPLTHEMDDKLPF